MRTIILNALILLGVFSVLTGLLYPLAMTAVASVAFPSKAGGSLLNGPGGKPAGSSLIGQHFTSPGYFWGRPSATSPVPCNGAASSGSNLGPTNPVLAELLAARAKALRDADPGNTASIPVDLLTASGSGLDPHISPAAARYQAGRVARHRNLGQDAVEELISWHTENRLLGVFGEPVVNVLQLNLALDKMAGGSPSGAGS